MVSLIYLRYLYCWLKVLFSCKIYITRVASQTFYVTGRPQLLLKFPRILRGRTCCIGKSIAIRSHRMSMLCSFVRRHERVRGRKVFIYPFFSLFHVHGHYLYRKRGLKSMAREKTVREKKRGRRGIDNCGNPLRPQTHSGHYFAVDVHHDGVP